MEGNQESPYRILVVDDEQFIRYLLIQMLEQSEIHSVVQTAENGKEALAKIRSFQPHLVLLDVIMPELDGIETCRTLKA